MTTSSTASFSPSKVGSYFVGQYYKVLQQQPDSVHQFYTDASSMLRVDGDTSQLADTMLQIHTLITSLRFTEIEIKTAHSLLSVSNGILVMVSGSVKVKDYQGIKRFAQTFFLAPQDNGYFVLNDIFHFLEDEEISEHPQHIEDQNHYDSLDTTVSFEEPVSDYAQGGETLARDFEAPSHAEENDSAEEYSPSEHEEQQHLPEVDKVEERVVVATPVEESVPSFLSEMNTEQGLRPSHLDEPVGEPQKQTYASILRVAKGLSPSPMAPQPSTNMNVPHSSEWQHTQQSNQQVYPAKLGRSNAEPVEEVAAFEEKGEVKSVYVRNLPPTISAFEIEQEFKHFGKLKPEGVAIRNREDIGVCYAFVEFEDTVGVQNAFKASPIQLGGRQVYIEERRASSSSTSRGGRGRGRGRGGYQTEGARGGGRLGGGRSFGREDGDYYNNRSSSRGNGFHQQRGTRQL